MWCIGNQALLSLCSGVSFTCKASSLKHREGLQQKSNLPLLLSPLFLPLARGTSQTKRPLRSYRSPSHFSKLKVQQNQTVSETLFTPRPRLLIANRAPPSASPNEKAPPPPTPTHHHFILDPDSPAWRGGTSAPLIALTLSATKSPPSRPSPLVDPLLLQLARDASQTERSLHLQPRISTPSCVFFLQHPKPNDPPPPLHSLSP